MGCALVVSDGSLNEIAETLDRFRDIFMRVILVDSRQGPRLNWEAAIDMAGVPGLEVRHNLLSRWAQLTKRLLDILLSVMGLVACAPLFLLLGVAIRLEIARTDAVPPAAGGKRWAPVRHAEIPHDGRGGGGEAGRSAPKR